MRPGKIRLTNKIPPRLVSLTLHGSRAEEADTLDLALNDSDGRLAIPSRGAVLRVSFGWSDTGLVDKGTYTVDEIEHGGAPDTLRKRLSVPARPR